MAARLRRDGVRRIACFARSVGDCPLALRGGVQDSDGDGVQVIETNTCTSHRDCGVAGLEQRGVAVSEVCLAAGHELMFAHGMLRDGDHVRYAMSLEADGAAEPAYEAPPTSRALAEEAAADPYVGRHLVDGRLVRAVVFARATGRASAGDAEYLVTEMGLGSDNTEDGRRLLDRESVQRLLA